MATPLRIWSFRIISIVLGTMVALMAAELSLRALSDHITASDQMAPGLIQHDPLLGWRLAPGWRGKHLTFDYEATYSTDARGLRQSEGRPGSAGSPVLVLGDSFVFGLGVNNSDTFVSCLNRPSANQPVPTRAFINGGIPGYSPDQVMLWAPRALTLSRATDVLLFVYLGNDLLDIGEAFPFQAPYAKPYAALDPQGQLVVRNQPVPAELRPDRIREIPADAIGGSNNLLFPGSQVLRLLREAGFGGAFNRKGADPVALDESIQPKLALFDAVLKEIRAGVPAGLTLAILPGANGLQASSNLSAAYQQRLRGHLLSLASAQDLTVIDLFPALADGSGYYYPNDGHLTVSGHQRVCEVVRDKYQQDGVPVKRTAVGTTR